MIKLIVYCESFVCRLLPLRKVVEHFYQFVEKIGLDLNSMLQPGMTN